MIKCLTSRKTIFWVMLEKLSYQINRLRTELFFRHEALNTRSLYIRKLKFHVRALLFILFYKISRSWTDDIVNTYYLIIFIITRKQWDKGKQFKYNAANAPHIHFITIVPVCHKAFRSTVPSGWNVFCARLLRVDATARPKICQFH